MIHQAAEKAVIKIIAEGGWIAPDYANRLKLPADFMTQVWALVDQDKVKKHLAERLEQELADRMVNHMAAELSTDIKQILSVTERREALRSLVRDHMNAIMQISPK
jgi:Mg/Co/Ni transporter MgtE